MKIERKLTAEDAADLRELYGSGDYTIRQLSEMYDVALTTAWSIITGRSYKDVSGGEPVTLPDGRHTFKKQGLTGADHPMHLLDESEVIAIRRKIAKDGVYGQKMKLYRALAYKYGIAQITVSSIAKQHTWKHLPSVEQLRKEMQRGGKHE